MTGKLILGANGFIGSHLLDALQDASEDCEVVALDRCRERYREELPGITYYYEDLNDRGALARIIAMHEIDVVVHLASATLPASSNEDPLFDISSNLGGAVRLLETCVHCDVRRVVFMSSGGTVYGMPEVTPVPESAPSNPICSYGVVKMAIEKYLHMYWRLHGLEYLSIRASNPYGERQQPGRTQGVIPVFIDRGLREEPIHVWGDGKVVRDYFYVKDLARFIVCAMESSSVGVYNIGSGTGITLNELLRLIREQCDIELDVRYGEARPFDVPELVLDVSRAQSEFDWSVTVGLEDGVRRVYQWLQR